MVELSAQEQQVILREHTLLLFLVGVDDARRACFPRDMRVLQTASDLAHPVYFQVYTVLFVLRRADFHTEMQRVPEVSARDCDFSNQDRGWECGNDTLQVTMETAIALWCGAESSKNTIAVP